MGHGGLVHLFMYTYSYFWSVTVTSIFDLFIVVVSVSDDPWNVEQAQSVHTRLGTQMYNY